MTNKCKTCKRKQKEGELFFFDNLSSNKNRPEFICPECLKEEQNTDREDMLAEMDSN